MLSRRSLFKSAATVGLSVLAPWLDRPTQSVVPQAGYGHEPSAVDAGTGHESSSLEREYLENLMDDLDCYEVVTRVGSTLINPPWTQTEPMRRLSRCSFCGEAGFRVGAE